MTRKLTVLFVMIALFIFIGVWLSRWVMDRPRLTPEAFLATAVYVAIGYFVAGMVLAKLGVNMVQEMVAERRSRDEERWHRARQLYELAQEAEGVAEASQGGGAS